MPFKASAFKGAREKIQPDGADSSGGAGSIADKCDPHGNVTAAKSTAATPKKSDTEHPTVQPKRPPISKRRSSVSMLKQRGGLSIKERMAILEKARDMKAALKRQEDIPDEIRMYQNIAGVQIQEKEQKRFLHPHGMLRQRWDMASISFIFYAAILSPLQVAFEIESKPLQYIDLMMDAFFVVDVVLNFFTGEIVNGSVRFDRWQIAKVLNDSSSVSQAITDVVFAFHVTPSEISHIVVSDRRSSCVPMVAIQLQD